MISQFILIATAHLFAVMSPGPDFALIIKQSLCNGRKISLITSIGIGTGILFHTFYCIVGLEIIINNFPRLFNLIQLSAALYLIYLGIQSILSISVINSEKKYRENTITKVNAFALGLFTNILNPKATLFFLSLYSPIIAKQTNIYLLCFYGVWMSFITTLWFSSLSIILTSKRIAHKISKFANFVQLGTGIMLIFIGLYFLYYI